MKSGRLQSKFERDGACESRVGSARRWCGAGSRHTGAQAASDSRWASRASLAIGASLLALLLGCGGGEETSVSQAAAATPSVQGSRVSGLAATQGPDSTAGATLMATAGTGPSAAAADTTVATATATATSTSTATAWTACAVEGQTCAFTGTKQVRYGALSSYVVLTLSGGAVCGNAVFTDPIYGTVKSCSFADIDPGVDFDPAHWTPCAAEGGSCVFSGSRTVRYGTPGTAVTQVSTGPTACSNAVFGDPVYGVAKSCWYSAQTSVPSDWTFCANESQRCSFTGTRAVRYGTATAFTTATWTGSVDCSNAVFGDPAYGIVKACSYSSVASTPPGGPLPATVASVTLPVLTVSAMGSATPLLATVVDAAGATISGATITWTIADPTIAALDAGGVVQPLRTGFTTVTASVGSKTATGVLTVRGSLPIPTRSQYVGTNLGSLAYYGTNFPFADLLKTSAGWGADNGNPFPSTSADGYPTALAPGQHAVASVTWGNTHYADGQYTLLWDGQGTMNFPWGNVRIVSSAANRIVVEPIDLNAAITVGIVTTSPANPVRNVRFLWPGTEATYAAQPFNPTYLARIAPFSVLRFMDWGATNGSPVVEWADRSLPTNAVYTSPAGVPIEVMIDLANSLHVDPWFCIPHMASDDYIRQFAALLHARLDPTLRPHVEYSNEVWNTGFQQAQWALAQSNARGLQSPYGQPSIFYARRSVQIFKLMQQVYGATDAHRLVRVIAGQSAWTQFSQNALADGDTAANADVLAIAPYFSADSADDPANVARTLASSPSQIVDQFLVSIRGNSKAQMIANAALAAQYHVRLRAYESGPGDSVGYFPGDKQDAMTALFAAANSSPRMTDVYTEYYGQWKAAGGETMNQYSDIGVWSKWGFWGALQYLTDDVMASPKYQGLMRFISANSSTAQQTTLKAPGSTN